MSNFWSAQIMHAAQSVDCWAFGYTKMPDTDVGASALMGNAFRSSASRSPDSKLVNTANSL